MIFSDKPLDIIEETPSTDQIEAMYRALFSETSKLDKDIPCRNNPLYPTFSTITHNDVKNAKMGWSNAAQGPDGVNVRQVKLTDHEWQSILYSTILLSRIKPERFFVSRTTLIYKTDDRRDPSYYRPITVSSVIQRLFHRIITKRLRSATYPNINQRGFISFDDILAIASFWKTSSEQDGTTANRWR